VKSPKNINEDIDIFLMGESDMPLWAKPKVDSPS